MFMVKKKSKDINLGDTEKTRILLCFNFVYLIIITYNCFGVAWMAVREVFLSRKSCKSDENTFPKDSLLGRNWPPDLMFATPALRGWWSDAKRLSRMFNLLNTQWNIFPECIKSLFKKGFESLKKHAFHTLRCHMLSWQHLTQGVESRRRLRYCYFPLSCKAAFRRLRLKMESRTKRPPTSSLFMKP